MSIIILRPSAVGSANVLTPIPTEALTLNFDKIKAYPDDLSFDRYLYALNNTLEDFYEFENIITDLSLTINSLSVVTKCSKDIITDICTAEQSILPNPPAGTTYRSTTANTLDLVFTKYSFSWTQNPDTHSIWTIAAINAGQYGLRLDSAGAASKSACSQLYLSVDISFKNEIASNVLESDTIHVDQDFTIIVQEDKGRSLFNTTSVNILYKLPDGTEGSLSANVIDDNRLVSVFSAALNDKTGKYWFKLHVVFDTDEILDGIPFFVNVQPKWIS